MRVICSFGIIALLACLSISDAEARNAHHHTANHKNHSLFSKIGGKKAISAVVNDLIARCASDNRINSFFGATASDPKRLKQFKSKLVTQICEATGGPCKYRGKSMKEAHAGMGIQEEHFNALVENLQASLNKFKVGPNEQKQILAALGPMKSDIVQSPNRETASAEDSPASSTGASNHE